MCTPQLRAQAAALQGTANPNVTAASAGGGTPPIIDPMRRQMLAVSPIVATQRFAPTVSVPAMGAGASPLRALGTSPNPGSGATGQQMSNERGVRASNMGAGAGMSISAMLASGAGNSAPPQPVLSPGNAKKGESYDEKHAPSPEILAETALHVKARTPFEPRQPGTPTPFSYTQDYRTTPEQRRWLMGVEAKLGDAPPYPDGRPGTSGYSPAERARMRIFTGYLYTLPEVKAFLDVLSTTEGTVKNGYFTTRFGRPPATGLARFASSGPQGRYQIEPGTKKEIIDGPMGRSDFSEVTQDMGAISLLVSFGAMKKLLAGDLRGAFSAASRAYASLPMSELMNHSGFSGSKWEPNDKPLPRQPAIDFAKLPELFRARLNSRRTEFREAQRDWETKRQMPWAFIPPYRQQYFGRDAFKPSR
jgi:hypothetical protein